MIRASLLILSLACCAPLGCSKGASLSGTVPASGTVMYKGAPLEGALVAFTPVAAEGKTANAVTDAQGNFTVQTYLGGTNQAKGALPGDYVVLIRKEEPLAEAGPTTADPEVERKKSEAIERGEAVTTGPKLLTPPKYAEIKDSPFKVTVKAGSEPFKFDLVD